MIRAIVNLFFGLFGTGFDFDEFLTFNFVMDILDAVFNPKKK